MDITIRLKEIEETEQPRGEQKPKVAKKPKKKAPRLSAAGRKALSEAMKARWARKKKTKNVK